MRSDKRTNFENMDERINAAVRSYAEPAELPDPRVALAGILSRARAEQPWGRRWGLWAAVPACALLIAAMLGAWMLRGPRAPRIAWNPRTPAVADVPVQFPKTATERSAAASLGRLPSLRQKGMHASPPGKTPLPKQDVFPTPRPLSPQEQALVAFVERAPANVQQAVIDDQQQWDRPMITAEGTIRPPGGDVQQNVSPKANPER